ncbi:hypothetical protein BZM27_50185 [Paraburkholderia steynii]|uniref:Lipoprotein n=1 Tax=Paraburkholderia steynii TaxID=1245441 RepID=A0A4R0XBC2_9BURK|nr:hypothetical protein BZM27_50185 [Paraburkholderia steynii]
MAMKLTSKHLVIAASVVMLAMVAPGCKRADNSTDAGGPAMGASGTMNNPAATGTMSPGGPAAASGASQ